MVKQDSMWYAHFVLSKTVELPDEPETVIAIDRGERNLAIATAISKHSPEKPMKGQFWRGSEIKCIRGLYSHIRRGLQEKKLLKEVKKKNKSTTARLLDKIVEHLRKNTDTPGRILKTDVIGIALDEYAKKLGLKVN